MELFLDIHGRQIRLTDERPQHLEGTHPEMVGQLDILREALLEPERIVESRSDSSVELYYRHYPVTPVTSKFMCAVT
ncbi:hypothetical protein BH23GEM7_BH23GEM7_27350 [soil metagenome]